jgi:hypothetical protein
LPETKFGVAKGNLHNRLPPPAIMKITFHSEVQKNQYISFISHRLEKPYKSIISKKKAKDNKKSNIQ